jgi:hypothetical protein
MAQPFYNPFLGPPPTDPNDMAAMMRRSVQDSLLQPPEAQLKPAEHMFRGQGPLLSLSDQAALEKAPKLPGTTVTVEAYPVGPSFDPANHMYVQFDDGKDSYIYRGGPGADGRLSAGVVPAHLSRDYGKGQTPMYQTFLPNQSAEQAIAPAQAAADRINRSDNPYGVVTSNSNSVVGDYTAQQYGHRVGQGPSGVLGPGAWTPGYGYDVPDHSPIPDLTPVIASPF